MADEQQPQKNNVNRRKPDKYLPEELVGEYDKFMSQRAAGEAKFDPATEALLKDIKLAAVNIAATKKAFVAASKAKAEKKLSDEEELEESDRRAKLNEVSVVEFSENALKQLKIGTVTDGDDDDDTEKKSDKDGDFLTKLFTAAVPLLAVGGALLGSITQMFQGGPLQGIANIMSKGFVLLFDALVKKLPNMNIFGKGGFVKSLLVRIFGEQTGKKIISAGSKGIVGTLFKGIGKAFLRRLPIIGSLISIGSAITRIKNGDYLGGLLDLGAGVAYMFPGVGTAIGIALDLFNAGLDIQDAKAEGGGAKSNINTAIVDAMTWVWEQVKGIFDKGIQFMVDSLYNLLPNGMVTTALNAIGLDQYTRSGYELEIEELEGKIASGEIGTERNADGKAQEKLAKLRKKDRKSKLKALKKGEISREEFLESQISQMHEASSGQERTAIRMSLDEAGFSGEEINKAYIEMKEMLELMKAQQEQQTQMSSPIISQNSQTSNQTNVFQHQSSGTQGDRMSQRNLTPLPA